MKLSYFNSSTKPKPAKHLGATSYTTTHEGAAGQRTNANVDLKYTAPFFAYFVCCFRSLSSPKVCQRTPSQFNPRDHFSRARLRNRPHFALAGTTGWSRRIKALISADSLIWSSSRNFWNQSCRDTLYPTPLAFPFFTFPTPNHPPSFSRSPLCARDSSGGKGHFFVPQFPRVSHFKDMEF